MHVRPPQRVLPQITPLAGADPQVESHQAAPAVPEAELGEVCGAEGPFRVLELQPDEVINYGAPQRIADRIYYTVYKRGETAPGSTFPEVIDPTIRATGPCGESPVKVATGVVGLARFDVWPDVPLGCDDATGQLVALDPAGVASTTVAS